MMKALTVWQPWASLIAIGAKPYEFRGWRPPASLIGQRLAIHAGARPMKRSEVLALRINLANPGRYPTACLRPDLAIPLLDRILQQHKSAVASFLPLSHILCAATVGEPKSGDECAREFGENAGNDSDREGTFNWGWPMLDIALLEPPEPARGAQGIWNWSGQC
ncbi:MULTISPECIES: ASCH domain-containing protein [Rhizobium]|uniref:ASCH domain-containing protein n=1 Tax=Rhizobium phaseoli TaxID=396 RepID=UPI000A1C0843|nr:ASCH domain-containing protein [Rhizobium phaseoli]ARM12084.1 ASC/PUA-like domain-containing protein [Rhizobium phaseoli Brasil 5]